MPVASALARNLMGVRRRRERAGESPGRRAADLEPIRGWRPALAIGLGVAMLDWTIKAAVLLTLPRGGFVEVIPGSLALWHVRNEAMILGLYGDLPLAGRKLIALAAALSGLVLMLQVIACGHRLPKSQRAWAWLFVGLVMGGMLGNMGERLLHWGVTDFISIGWGDLWLPPGNVADLALFASIPLAGAVTVMELMARSRRGTRVISRPTEVMGD